MLKSQAYHDEEIYYYMSVLLPLNIKYEGGRTQFHNQLPLKHFLLIARRCCKPY
jgi:hypothetical protein